MKQTSMSLQTSRKAVSYEREEKNCPETGAATKEQPLRRRVDLLHILAEPHCPSLHICGQSSF